MDKIRILLADDHQIVRQGIYSLLKNHDDLEIVGETKDGRETVKMARELKPDVVLMDIAMPILNGLEATRQIKKTDPKIKVLILTIHKNEEYVLNALQVGASGYLEKDTGVDELLNAIHSVYHDNSFLSPGISKTVIDAYLLRASKAKESTVFETLSNREREVLQLIAEGFTNREVAKQLFIAVKTVEAHRAHIMGKLDIHDIAKLVKYAIRKGMVDLNT